MNWMPQRGASPSAGARNRSCVNGMRNSAVHPSESRAAAASHTAFHPRSSFHSVSPDSMASCFTPSGLMAKRNAVRRSK